MYRFRITDLHVVKHVKESYILKKFTLIVEVYNSVEGVLSYLYLSRNPLLLTEESLKNLTTTEVPLDV